MPPHRVYIESHLGGGACMLHKRPATVNIGIDRDEHLIDQWRESKRDRCELVAADAAEYLNSYNFSGDELVYADPPYLPSTRRGSRRVYRYDYVIADHVNLLKVLKGLRCLVMLSGYESELYDDELASWRRVEFRTMSHVGMRKECLWMNFPQPTQLHDTRFVGDTFRVRQNWRRKHLRLLRKISAMQGPERQHFIASLSEQLSREESR